MTESAHEHVESVIAGKAHRDWVNGLLIVIVLVLLGWITWDHAQASARAETATANAQTLAEQVQAACLAGDVIVSDKNICARADAVADQPAVPVEGAQGPPGVSGTNGMAGRAGIDGLNGTNGTNGINGTVGTPGELGVAGLNGQPGTAGTTGPNGEPGVTGAQGLPGAAGPAGTPGALGRGIASIVCTDSATTTPPAPITSSWVITYTDATASTTPGPCRVAPSPVAP